MAINVTDKEWKKKLTPKQYYALRQKGTEIPGSGELLYNTDSGMYICAACGNPLFSSTTKYDSTTPGLIGWPSFTEATNNDAIELKSDNSLFMHRTEVICKNCGGHLGHLFEDASSPNGQHFCINSDSLAFEKEN
jgi:peptide-methionine (R)-S-oxide reductase